MGERSLFAAGFVLGALAGAATALLLTPYSGDEVRDQLKERGIELKGEAERRATGVKQQASQFADDARGQAQQLQEKGRIVLSDNVKKAQEAVQVAQDKLAKSEPDVAEEAPAS